MSFIFLVLPGSGKKDIDTDNDMISNNSLLLNEMNIKIAEFKNGESIPKEYTCQGNDTAPLILIEDIPIEARSLSLIVDDPDAPSGTWVHWLLWNILPEEAVIDNTLLNKSIVVGKNSWGNNLYGGPCPPIGTHRYFFKVYALDKILDIGSSSSVDALEREMEGHIILSSEYLGTYTKE